MTAHSPKVTTYHSKEKTLIGIDPATEGSAVVVKESTAAVCFLWKKARRNKQKCFAVKIWDSSKSEVDKIYVRAISDIGFLIANHESLNDGSEVSFCCEDTHYANARSTIIVSRIGGAIVAPLEHKFQKDVVYVKANAWRHKVLGLNHFTKRKEAKEKSLTVVPTLLSGLSKAIINLGRYDHITDAAGVALFLQSLN